MSTTDLLETPVAEDGHADVELNRNPLPMVGLQRWPRAVAPQGVPPGADMKHPSLYFNMELGWLDFNWRVLYQALDDRLPLLERVRFIAITASNLDEFIQKRVGGLKRQEAAQVTQLSPDGRTPTEQLNLIRPAIRQMHRAMTAIWQELLVPSLRDEANIHILSYAELTDELKDDLHHYFQTEIYPVLTPLALDPGHPFPFISNLSLSFGVILRNPKQGTSHFARLKVPRAQRWLHVGHPNIDGECYLPVEQLIVQHVDELFPEMDVESVHFFRITRNADIRRAEEEAEDLLAMISEELRERRSAQVVQLEIQAGMSATSYQVLTEQLGLGADDVIEVDGLLDLTSCFQIADLDLPEHQFERWVPAVPNQFQVEGGSKDTSDLFAIIRQRDLLVHHPYESFAASVQRLVAEAAVDPDVVAIKQTLYRTSDESPIVKALIQAAENGKQVAVLVEVKARFDEANNIEWARKLENSGVHVAYGLVGLKTHTKATLIVRREDRGLRTYCHIGTGNYHPKTAKIYTDLGLFTADPELGRDVVNLFHFLTGYAPGMAYEQVLVAPNHMRKPFEKLIQAEIDNQVANGNGRIIAKMNALDDKKMIQIGRAFV